MASTGTGRARHVRFLDDSFIAGAATQISSQRFSHVLFRRIRITAQQGCRIHQEAGCTEAALQCVLPVKSLLQFARLSILGQSLDRCDLMSIRLDRQHQTRADRLTVEQYRTRAAGSVLATDVRASQSQILAQKV
jgi:hypothetical protein